MTLTLGVDLSNHQAEPNWPLLARAVGFVALKATEGVGFTDRTWAPRRAAAHAAGIPAVGAYHFARLGDVRAEAAAFLSALGALAPTEFAALDLEVAAPGVDPVAWSAAWLDIVHAATGRWPLIYLNGSELRGLNWAPITARGVHLWLASYDQSTAPVGSGQFPALTVKQFTDAATVAGVAGPVDEDVLYGSPLDLTGGDDDMPPYNSWPAADKAQLCTDVANMIADRVIVGDGSPANPALKLWEVLNQTHSKVCRELYDLTGRPQDRKDDLLGHVLSADARARDAEAKVDQLLTAVAALTAVIAALPGQTAAALPAMACAGNPKAVLGALGQAATAAATA